MIPTWETQSTMPSFRGARSASPESILPIVVMDSGPAPKKAHPGMTKRLLLRRRGALHKRLAALHLVGQRGFVDLDHDRIGIDAEVFHQRLRDVAHHAGLLVIGAAGGHAYGDLRHFCSPFLFPSWPGKSAKRVFPLNVPAIHDLPYQTRRASPAQD